MMHYWGNYTTFGGNPFLFFGLMGVVGLFAAVLVALVLLLKGYSLWHAAKRDEKGWFIALLILNTAGILELVYLIFIVKLWPKIYNGPKNGPKAN